MVAQSLVSVAGGDAAAVDIDFVVDEVQVLLEFGELDDHLGTMRLHQGQSLVFVARPRSVAVVSDRVTGSQGRPVKSSSALPVSLTARSLEAAQWPATRPFRSVSTAPAR